LSAVSRCIACITGLTCNQAHLPVTGGELATLLELLRRELVTICQAVAAQPFQEAQA
jgi:hypothetical protein